MITREGILHRQVCEYLKRWYPDAIFRTDFAAGVKMTIGQAVRHKKLQSGRAYPDLFIAEPRKRQGKHYCGLYIELKPEGTVIYKKDGEIRADAHIKEQFAMLQELKKRGYWVNFAVGFDEARLLIDNYLKD